MEAVRLLVRHCPSAGETRAAGTEARADMSERVADWGAVLGVRRAVGSDRD